MLTLKQLQAMPEGTIFAIGTAIDDDSVNGLFMGNTKQRVRWVAVRGGIDDWAIYCHFAEKSLDWIKKHGDKICDEIDIKRCVPCDKEAFGQYRF